MYVKVDFIKRKFRHFPLRKCTILEYDNVTINCYPIFVQLSQCPLVAYGKLKTKENFKFLALKVVAVAYERWLLYTRGFKYSDLTSKILVLLKTGL